MSAFPSRLAYHDANRVRPQLHLERRRHAVAREKLVVDGVLAVRMQVDESRSDDESSDIDGVARCRDRRRGCDERRCARRESRRSARRRALSRDRARVRRRGRRRAALRAERRPPQNGRARAASAAMAARCDITWQDSRLVWNQIARGRCAHGRGIDIDAAFRPGGPATAKALTTDEHGFLNGKTTRITATTTATAETFVNSSRDLGPA